MIKDNRNTLIIEHPYKIGKKLVFSVVWILIDIGKLADQITRLVAIVVYFAMW